MRSLSAPVRRPTMSATRIAAIFRVSKPEALLQELLHIVPPSRNVRFLRIAVVPSLPSNYRNPHEAAMRVLQSYVRFGETAQPRWMATMGAKLPLVRP